MRVGSRQLVGLAYFAETSEAARTELSIRMHILQHDVNYMGAALAILIIRDNY